MSTGPSTSSAAESGFQTKSLGRLVVGPLLGGHMIDIEKQLGRRKKLTPLEFIDIFISAIVVTSDGKKLTSEQIEEISAEEKELFAEGLVETNDYLYRKIVYEKTKDENGRTVLNSKLGEIKLARKPEEKAIEYFQRAYMHHLTELREKWRSTLRPLSDISKFAQNLAGWAKPRAIDELIRNSAVSDSLTQNLNILRAAGSLRNSPLGGTFRDLAGLNNPRDSLPPNLFDEESERAGRILPMAETKAFEIPIIPNPIHGTNDRLDNLIGRFDKFEVIAGQTVELVQSMNNAASSLLQSFAEGAKSTEQFSRRSIWIAAMALAVGIFMPVVQVGYDIWKSREQDGQTKVAIEEVVRQVTASQQQASNGVRDILASQADRTHLDQVQLANAITALEETLKTLKGQVAAIEERKK